MAVLQRSYVFTTSSIDIIFSQCDRSSYESFRLDLHQIAVDSLTYAKNLPDYLRFLRFDEEEWLTINPEYYQIDNWFLICLGKYCKPNWDLSRVEPYSYWLVSEVLSSIGWTEEKIDGLIHGMNLSSLTSFSSHPFSSDMNFCLYQGGWLGASELQSYRKEIMSLRDLFYQPSAKFLSSLELEEFTEFDERQIVKRSYDDLVRMTFFPDSEGDAIFLIYD